MRPKSFWDGQEYIKQHNADLESGKIKRDTLEDDCKIERDWIKRGNGVHPSVLAVSFIRLMIWRHGPRDVKTIDLLLDGLAQQKRESKLAEDIGFYQAQIVAYMRLRLEIKRRMESTSDFI